MSGVFFEYSPRFLVQAWGFRKIKMRYERSNPKGGREMERPTDGANEIWTVSMLARYLRCHPSTIYRLLKRGQIPAFKIGSDWRFQKAVIERWLKKSTIDSLVN
jgi:excisionase family DNA binding protein